MFGLFFIFYLAVSQAYSIHTNSWKPTRTTGKGERDKMLNLIEHLKSSMSPFYKSTLIIPIHKNYPELLWDLLSEEPKLIGNPSNNLSSQVVSGPFIFLIWLGVGDTVKNLPPKCNHHKDRFIFMGNQHLKELMKRPDIQKLHYKIGIYYDEDDPDGLYLTVTNNIERNEYQVRKVTDISDLIHSPRTSVSKDLGGRHFQCSGSPIAPYIFPIPSVNKFGEKFDGTHYRVVSESSVYFNFTFRSYAPPGQSYGSLLPNGTWIHMLADIYYEDKEYEIAYNLGFSHLWNGLVQYAAPLGQVRLTFLIHHPQTLTISMEAFIMPFNLNVWVAFIATFFAISLTIYISLQYSVVNNGMRVQSRGLLLFQAFEIPYRIALEQDVKIPTGLKILGTLWIFFGIIMGTGYKSNLVSYLSIPVKETVPRNMRELADRGDYKVIVNNLGAVEKSLLQDSDLQTVKDIIKRIDWEPNTETCVMTAFIDKKSVCIGWDQVTVLTAASVFSIKSQTNPLYQSFDAITEVYLTLAFRNDFKYQEHFRFISYAFYESGILKKWEDEVLYIFKLLGVESLIQAKQKLSSIYKTILDYDRNAEKKTVNSLSLTTFRVVFLILGFGFCIAVPVVVLELLIKPYIHVMTI